MKGKIAFAVVFLAVLIALSHTFRKSENQFAAEIITTEKWYKDACADLDAFLRDSDFSGTVLLAKKHKILFAKGYGLCDEKNPTSPPNSIHTRFEAGSLSKQLVAAAILSLEHKKKLSRSDTLQKYFPEFEGGEEITIEMLLNMRSGLTDHINAGAEFFPRAVLRQVEKSQRACEPVAQNLVLEYAPSAPRLAKPGSTYFYCNTNYYLLAKIIEQVSGEPYHDYMTEHILKPAKMTLSNFDFQDTDARGYEHGKYYSIPAELAFGCGDLNSTVMDLYRWTNALTDGKYIGKKTLAELKKTNGYHYGLNCGNNLIFHGGTTNVFNSYSSYNFKNKTTVIVLANTPPARCNATVIAGKLRTLMGW